MALRPLTLAKLAKGVHTASWDSLRNGDTGAPLKAAGGGSFMPDKCVHIIEVASGAGDTVVIQGSNDGTNWITLTDIHSNAMSYAAAALIQVSENPLELRPNITGGDGTTDFDVIIVMYAVRR